MLTELLFLPPSLLFFSVLSCFFPRCQAAVLTYQRNRERRHPPGRSPPTHFSIISVCHTRWRRLRRRSFVFVAQASVRLCPSSLLCTADDGVCHAICHQCHSGRMFILAMHATHQDHRDEVQFRLSQQKPNYIRNEIIKCNVSSLCNTKEQSFRTRITALYRLDMPYSR